jgi:molecular chaperone IbpA
MKQYSIQTLDLPNFVRNSVGFDRLFEDLNRTFANSRGGDNYPPYNISKLDEAHWVIEVAVAGFAENEIDVELKESTLTIRGTRESNDKDVEYIHKGISSRNFERTYTLGAHVEVRGATVKNGILSVALEQVIPEAERAKKIPITFTK